MHYAALHLQFFCTAKASKPESICGCLFAPCQTFFSVFSPIHYILANDLIIMRPRDQEYNLAYTPVEIFLIDDSALTEPSRRSQPILTSGDRSSGTAPSSQDQMWIKDVASLFMIGRPGIRSTSNSAENSLDQLLPRSKFQRRSSSSTTRQIPSCEESKESCVNPEIAHELENADERNPDSPNLDRAPPILQDILMLVRIFRSLSQKPYERGCGTFLFLYARCSLRSDFILQRINRVQRWNCLRGSVGDNF